MVEVIRNRNIRYALFIFLALRDKIKGFLILMLKLT